ncbi:MAG: hypothetical protein Q8R26_00080 [bacterium]|nr:hypothetical protein [bacterium]
MEPETIYTKNRFWRFASILVLMIIVVGSAYFVWDRFFSEVGFARRQAAQLESAEKAYVKAMTADTYGGKSPQETLDMFITALEKGDIELASKYFLLDINENYSREVWIDYLENIKSKNLLSQMASDIKNTSQPDLKNIVGDNDYKFILYTDEGKVGARVNMQFNDISKVWKIENF